MAGAGFKSWVDGDILTASDVNTYLMQQAVMVFADASARTSAIAAPSEGMVTYLTGTDVIEYYDGAAWQPILDQDVIEAKGDLIAGTADDTVARLAVGTDGYVLTADSGETTGLKWAAAAGGGKVLQVVQATTTTSTTISSATLTDTTLTATITPAAATSKVLVIANQFFYATSSDAQVGAGWRLLRGATTIHTLSDGNGNGMAYVSGGGDTSQGIAFSSTMVYLDSPSTTSATTYKTQGRNGSGSGSSITFQNGSLPSTITLIEIGA